MPKRKESKRVLKAGKAASKPGLAKEKSSKAEKLAGLRAPSEAEYLKSREDIADKEDTLDIVSFYLNDNLFAVEVEHVGAVIMSREIVELPQTPDFIDGLISVRGKMVLVMNLKRRLGIDPGSSVSENIIVTEPSSIGNETGMIVDRMAGVMEVDALSKAPVKSLKGKMKGLTTKERGYVFIKGTVESDAKGSIKVLDMAKLMAFDMPSGAS